MSNAYPQRRIGENKIPTSAQIFWDMPTLYYKNLPVNFSDHMKQNLDTPVFYTSFNSSQIGAWKDCENCENGLWLERDDLLEEAIRKNPKLGWCSCPECGRSKYFGYV